MLIAFNKPYNVVCQFRPHFEDTTLADFITISNLYPAGRLDKDSEGLLLLTDDGHLQHQITQPDNKMSKSYWVEVEGSPNAAALQKLQEGVMLKDGMTRPAIVKLISEPPVWPRHPPVRVRKSIPTSWLDITITEGRNRQVRRMTAAINFPTLRLIRYRVGPWYLNNLQPGDYEERQIPKAVEQKLTSGKEQISSKQNPRTKKQNRKRNRK